MGLSFGDRVDRYVVVGLLGRGGMGEVYRVRDPKLQRDVALKIVRVDAGFGTDGGPRLLREARASASLTHPNVLAVYDVGEVAEPEALRGLTYIAMELVVGKSLRAFVGDPTVPLQRRIDWLRDVARALAAAHDAGLVHRDVKPENVMVRDDGAVKVLDFGIARRGPPSEMQPTTDHRGVQPTQPAPPSGLSAPLTGEGVAIGTPAYMAPEQLRAEALDGRADQFAWGVLAYEVLTGKLPWSGPDALALVSAILSRNPPPPSEVEPQIPGSISSAIVRALAKDPADRFASMHELLARYDAPDSPGSSTRAFPATSPVAHSTAMPPVARQRSSRPRGMFVGGAALAGAALLTGAVWLQRLRASTPAAVAAVPAASVATCTSSAACSRAHGDGAWRCNGARHQCVEIASADCRVSASASDLARDDTVWFGGLFPLTGDAASDILSETQAVELARRDFADAVGVGAPRAGELHASPIATVICDEAKDPERAARHLAQDVEVPAVIGFRWSATALETIPSVFQPAHVLSFISISQDPVLTKIPAPKDEPRLVWRSTLDGTSIAAPVAALIARVLEQRARGPSSGGRPSRVAVVRDGSRTGYLEELFRQLRFNGKSALENRDDFRQYVLDPTRDGGADSPVDTIAAFAPDVIVIQAGAAFGSRVLAPLEKRWGSAPRPVYVTTSDLPYDVEAFAGKDATRRHRFLGVTNASTTMPNAQLVLHYNSAFASEPVTRTSAPQPSYDAFYTLAYALESLGASDASGAIDGRALSRAFARLGPPGTPVDVGPSAIFGALETLRSGANIDLNGAIGSLDFDPATGEAPIDYAVICLGTDDHGAASGSVESGLVYDSRTRELRGEMKCP